LFGTNEIWAFEIILNLACAKPPPAKALCGGQALRRRQGVRASDLEPLEAASLSRHCDTVSLPKKS